MKYYKGNDNQVFAFSEIQTPPHNLTEMTEEEVEARVNTVITEEQVKETRTREILARLTELDTESIRSLRATAYGSATERDSDALGEIEVEAKDLRIELNTL